MKPADWPGGRYSGTLTFDASCTPEDITYPTYLKLINEMRESIERTIDDLCFHHSELRNYKPKSNRCRALAAFIIVAKQEKPRYMKINAAIRCQSHYLQRNLDAIDATMISGTTLSGLNTHFWQKLPVISELHTSKVSFFFSKMLTMPHRIVNFVQRRVMLIVCGKAKAAFEFSAKIGVSVRNGVAFLCSTVGIHRTRPKT